MPVRKRCKFLLSWLNLAQTVMLYAWELSKMDFPKKVSSPIHQEESIRALLQKVQMILLETGFRK
ncbi:MAG: hypothetical protein PHV35_09550 [Mariniphaga sp.]|nr:hypothetical protein [Mariniphaga sp.]